MGERGFEDVLLFHCAMPRFRVLQFHISKKLILVCVKLSNLSQRHHEMPSIDKV